MNSLITNIYSHMPVVIQNMGISAYGYCWKKHRFGHDFYPEVLLSKEREFYTYQQWEKYQTLALRKLLVHAFESVPFYREKYSSLGIDKGFLEHITLERLNLLPYTTKDEFRKYGITSMLCPKLSKGIFEQSSGSTGTPVQIFMPDYVAQRVSAYMETRVRNWAGVSYMMPRGMVGGRRIISGYKMTPPFYRYNYFEKQTYFSAYHISEKTINNYIEGMVKNKVEWMTGYAMSNYFIADLIRKNGLKAPKMKAVITSSEKLTKEMRKTISDVFSCKVYDSYSGCEACGLISESPAGELLVNPDVGIMEFVDAEGKYVSDGEMGEIISTGLINFDQPLIRYRIGDLAKLAASQHLQTNHQMVKIDEIIGRVEDIVVANDGRRLVRFHGIFVGIQGLISSQLVQKSYTDFVLRLIVDTTIYDQIESEKIMRQRLVSQVGEVKIVFEYVNTLPAGSNGKIKAVVSLLS